MIVHILADGKRVDDITGYVVRVEDARPLYNLIANINRKGSKKKIVHCEKSHEVKLC